MRRALSILIAFLVASIGLVIAQERFTFYVSVRTPTGEPVKDLHAEELSVTEDELPGRIITVTPVHRPVKVTVLLDNGFNTESLLVIYRNGLKAFFEGLPAGVEAALVTLAPAPRFLIRSTADRSQLLAGLDLLAPDRNAPRLVDGLVEAANRFEQENRKPTHFPVVMVVSTTGPEGSRPGDRDLERIGRQFNASATRVHVIMLSTNGVVPTDVLGSSQVHVAKSLADQTGGRYEALAAPTRIATLLPEYAKMIGDAHAFQSDQYIVTAERPAGAKGASGRRQIRLSRSSTSFTISLDGLKAP